MPQKTAEEICKKKNKRVNCAHIFLGDRLSK